MLTINYGELSYGTPVCHQTRPDQDSYAAATSILTLPRYSHIHLSKTHEGELAPN